MLRFSVLDKALAIVVVSILAVSPFLVLRPDVSSRSPTAHALAAGDPIAVISPLPVVLSNGTWALLNASGSSDPDGILVNFTWEVTVSTKPGENIVLYGRQEIFKFREAGYYTINLMVRDDNGSTNETVAYVWSFADIDFDTLPDWWEKYYFGDLSQNASGDPDHDGYTNIEEFGSGTNPTVKDPPPGLVTILKENWMYLAAIIAVVVLLAIVLWSQLRKRRRKEEKKMVAAAIEIERAIEMEK